MQQSCFIQNGQTRGQLYNPLMKERSILWVYPDNVGSCVHIRRGCGDLNLKGKTGLD